MDHAPPRAMWTTQRHMSLLVCLGLAVLVNLYGLFQRTVSFHIASSNRTRHMHRSTHPTEEVETVVVPQRQELEPALNEAWTRPDKSDSLHTVGEAAHDTVPPVLLPVINDTDQDVIPVEPVLNDTNIAVYSVHVSQQGAVNDTSRLAYLPLLPWEQQSLETRECLPPADVPDYCCIGSLSQGGHIFYERNGCHKGAATYQALEQWALEAVSHVPIIGTERTSALPPVECDWCRILDLLLQNNWTMALVGDSITGQSFFGAECEVRRRQYVVHRNVEERRNYTTHGVMTVTTLHVSRTTPPRATDLVETVVLRYYLSYRIPLPDDVMELTETCDVLIFDHGLHYQPEDYIHFESHMTSMLTSLLLKPTPWQLLAWRETSAQHFDTSGGHWSRDSAQCTAMNDTDTQQLSRRWNVMERVVEDHNWTSHVTLLPFWNYTRPLHDLHVGPGDCTHFCTHPALWLYQWRTIRNALEQSVSSDADKALN